MFFMGSKRVDKSPLKSDGLSLNWSQWILKIPNICPYYALILLFPVLSKHWLDFILFYLWEIFFQATVAQLLELSYQGNIKEKRKKKESSTLHHIYLVYLNIKSLSIDTRNIVYICTITTKKNACIFILIIEWIEQLNEGAVVYIVVKGILIHHVHTLVPEGFNF